MLEILVTTRVEGGRHLVKKRHGPFIDYVQKQAGGGYSNVNDTSLAYVVNLSTKAGGWSFINQVIKFLGFVVYRYNVPAILILLLVIKSNTR